VFARRRGACGVGGGVLDLVDGLEISLCTTRDGWCCQWLLQANVRAGRLRGCSLDAVVLMAAFWYHYRRAGDLAVQVHDASY
jgi:hypothetical protein